MATDDEISDLIDKITTTGKDVLDPALLKKLKTYCKNLSSKKDETSYEYLVRVIFRQMEKNHAQIRYGCMLVIEYLFEKAHHFRKIVATKKLSKLFRLCFDLGNFSQRNANLIASTSLDPRNASTAQNIQSSASSSRGSSSRGRATPLLPAKWAKKLRLKAASVVRYWSQEFGRCYTTLQCGLRFLEFNNVDFEDPEVEAQRIEERLRLRNLDQLEKEFKELEDNCDGLILQIDNSFELLIPRFEFIGEEDDEEEGFNFRPMRGLSFNIFLNRQVEIVEDDSNCDIIANLKDLCNQLHSVHQSELLPLSDKVSKLDFRSDRLVLLKEKCQSMQAKIMTIVCKSSDMKIVKARPEKDNTDDSDDEDDDFEDVDDGRDEEAEYIAQMMVMEEANEKSRKSAPEVINHSLSFGAGSSSLPHHNDLNQPSTSSSLTPGSTLQCRALLPSGRLCPRQDKKKCPFHGTIIERDNEGLPVDAQLRKAELDSRAEAVSNEWRDPAYLQMLSERTGIDLTGKNIGKRKRKYPNLIDINKAEKSVRKRLMRKFGKKHMQQMAGIHQLR